MIHIIVGQEAASNLAAAFELDENLSGEIIVLKDELSIGPIAVQEERNHDAVRNEFRRMIHHDEQSLFNERDQIKLLITKAQREEEPVCFWLAPNANDICTYYWLLPYFKAFPDLLHTINIIGLPFLNEKGQLFYPSNFSQVIPKEFLKTKRLLKEVSPSEYEVDGDEWAKLQSEDQWVRIYDGGKKINSKKITHFDTCILGVLTTEFQKGSKVVNEALKKSTQLVSHAFLEWRLRELVQQSLVHLQGDSSKAIKDFEVKKLSEIIEKNEEMIQDDPL